MAKLYPPGLAGTLPAFYNLARVGIPFTRNKAVANNSENIYKIIALVKSINGFKIYGTVPSIEIDWEKDIVYFNFDNLLSEKIERNNFYKIQLAYQGKDEVIGYYSTVGVIRYTNAPTINISNLIEGVYNSTPDRYIGVYSNQDIQEKVYSYRFIIYDENNNIYEDSGHKIHNHDYDTYRNRSTDEFYPKKSLNLSKPYSIVYEVTTVNGLVVRSNRFYLKDLDTEPLNSNIAIEASLDEENAYVQIMAKMTEGFDVPNGSFMITRACSKDNYSSWKEIKRFVLENSSLKNSLIFRDYTIEHGYSYKYGIQQYNKYNYKSNREETLPLEIKFEHIYLFDGEKQLKIKFNPKVSNYKETFQEQKITTLGAKYPYFLRNGASRFKELTVNGLISYLSDEQELFMSSDELFVEELQLITPDQKRDNFSYEYTPNKKNMNNTRLDDSNILAERKFRDKVLEFLNDGKPKVFKSSTEGNMIVRCMNNTLTPNDTLGRMLYTFNSALTEIEDYTWENLIKYDLIDISYPTTGLWFWKTIATHDYYQIMDVKEYFDGTKNDNPSMFFKANDEEFFKIDLGYDIYGIDITDAAPGTKYYINGQIIYIGVTGQYQIELNSPIESLGVQLSHRSGWITLRYTRETYNEFNVEKGLYQDKPSIIQQFLGKRNIMEELDNTWEELSSIDYFKFSRRPRVKLYTLKSLLLNPESVHYEQVVKGDYKRKKNEYYDEIIYPGPDGVPNRFYALDVNRTYDAWVTTENKVDIEADRLRSQIPYFLEAIEHNRVDYDVNPRFVEVTENNRPSKTAIKNMNFYILKKDIENNYYLEWVQNFTKWDLIASFYKPYTDPLPDWEDKGNKTYYYSTENSNWVAEMNKNVWKNGKNLRIYVDWEEDDPNRITYYTRNENTQVENDTFYFLPLLETYFPELKDSANYKKINNGMYEANDWYLHIRNNKKYKDTLKKLSQQPEGNDYIPSDKEKQDFIQNILMKTRNYYNYKIYFMNVLNEEAFEAYYKQGILYERIEVDKKDRIVRFANNEEIYYIDKECTIRFPVEDISEDFVYEVVSVQDSIILESNATTEVYLPDKGIVYLSSNANWSMSITNQAALLENNNDLRKMFSKLGQQEKTEFYIVNNKNKKIPKKSYVQRKVQSTDSYSKDTIYRLKQDLINYWVVEGLPYIKKAEKNNDIQGIENTIIEFTDKDKFETYQNNTMYTLVTLDEIHDTEYVLRRWVNNSNYSEDIYYIKNDEGNYEISKEAFDANERYYTKGIKEDEIVIYTVDSVKGTNTIGDRQYIHPNFFDCSVKFGINVPKDVDDNTVSTQKEMIFETLDLEKDIVITGKHFSNVMQLEIGWGVDCIIHYFLRMREYGFKNLPAHNDAFAQTYTSEQKIKDYVKYINALSDNIFFYREGGKVE